MSGERLRKDIMLKGRIALIVEEEFLIALDIQRMLENHDVEQTLFARSAGEAESLRARRPDIAVVEIRAEDTASRQLVQELNQAGVAVVLTTADARMRHGFPDMPGLAVVIKPVPEDAMASAIEMALAARG